jgi:hypothetical protein
VPEFEDRDYWKGIVLYGLNSATYKIALGKTLLALAGRGAVEVPWSDLSREFLEQYLQRLNEQVRPQQGNPKRRTVMETIVSQYHVGAIDLQGAIDSVGSRAFEDVIPRFQTIGTDTEIVRGRFYEYDAGHKIVLTDALLSIQDSAHQELGAELGARWSLLEGAFLISQKNFTLANDIRGIYLAKGYDRTDLTGNIPFLSGYQGNICFYCSEPIAAGDIHVDHVIPRQVVRHDEIWNLVLSHSSCNLLKSDHLVAEHYVRKLIARNENIMGSNHPWRHKISAQLGKTPQKRGTALRVHYDRARKVLGPYYWGGDGKYVAEHDPFFRKLITVINNRGES